MARTPVLPKKIIKLLEQDHFLTANQIIELIAQSEKKYNKTSVYRALDKLLEENLICKENFGETESMYELRTHHHDHAVCTSCEKIIAVECQSHSEKKVPGFTVDHHHTTLYGTCTNCVTEKKENSPV